MRSGKKLMKETGQETHNKRDKEAKKDEMWKETEEMQRKKERKRN